jgi:hypothetical protein
MAWIHPLLGAIAVAGVVWMAWVGLNARPGPRRPGAGAARRQHARVAPAVGALVGLAAAGGLLSAGLLRDDIDLLSTAHGWAGLGCAAFAAASWATARRRRLGLHPYLGLGLLMAAVGALLLGLEHLP